MTNAANPQQSYADIATGKASLYLQQLCKHFAHKLDVKFDDRTGSVRFSIGRCELLAQDGLLRLSLDAPDAEALLQLQDVVERHLIRFAFRENLSVEWRSGSPDHAWPIA